MIARATRSTFPRRVARPASLPFRIALLLGLGLSGSAARANGRFPNAGFVVVGPGARRDTVALQLTFGYALSRDRGATWAWICEDAYDTPSGWDAPSLVGPDGALSLSLLTGLRRSVDGCVWQRPAGTNADPSVDLAADATGRVVVAVSGRAGELNRLLRSEDGGASFTPGATLPGVFVETVEVAPSQPMRVYVTGQVSNNPVLYRSDDGGATVREITRSFDGGYDAFLSAVDPRNPDVVYVRVSLGLETRLLRSDDGGAHFTRIQLTRSPMLGFALSDDGNTVWTASADEGLQRSVGGAPFAPTMSRIRARCLRYASGSLYACGDSRADGFALARSDDQGDRFDVLLRLPMLPGAVSCSPGTEGAVCAAEWPAMSQFLRDQLDAGAPLDAVVPRDTGAPQDTPRDLGDEADPPRDVPVDATRPDATVAEDRVAPTEDVPVARDVAPTDTGLAPADAGRPVPPTADGCRCRAAAPPRSPPAGLGLLVALGLACLHRRRRLPPR